MISAAPFSGIDFDSNSDLSSWRVVDDTVMGGRSDGAMFINEDGHAQFSGIVSLENNGGFSSIRYRTSTLGMEDKTHFVLRVKGDGKKYQLRVKPGREYWYTFSYSFQTSGDWETIRVPMNEMYPSWRGQRLDFENYDGSSIAELGFLIGNYKAESFKLEIDYIAVE